MIITINIDEKALKRIDAGAEKDNRSRSKFLELAGLQRAKKINEVK